MSANRLPPVKREDLPQSEQAAFDSLTKTTTAIFGSPEDSPFIYQHTSNGEFVGPFPLFLAAPEAGEYTMGLYAKLAAIPGLPADAREVAILTVGARYESKYELYAHTNVATKKVGMDQEVVGAIARGEKPKNLNEACSTAYDAAIHLAGTPGPLPKQLWDRSIEAFGRSGTVALMHYIGAYAYTSILLNAMDCPVPE